MALWSVTKKRLDHSLDMHVKEMGYLTVNRGLYTSHTNTDNYVSNQD